MRDCKNCSPWHSLKDCCACAIREAKGGKQMRCDGCGCQCQNTTVFKSASCPLREKKWSMKDDSSINQRPTLEAEKK